MKSLSVITSPSRRGGFTARFARDAEKSKNINAKTGEFLTGDNGGNGVNPSSSSVISVASCSNFAILALPMKSGRGSALAVKNFNRQDAKNAKKEFLTGENRDNGENYTNTVEFDSSGSNLAFLASLAVKNFRRGFTMIELLVVIIIIMILIGILIPVVAKIRQNSYDTTTRNEISEIANACNRYYNDFNAYPGPFSNSDIENQYYGTVPPINVVDTYYDKPLSGTNSVTSKYMYVSGAENLVLGLLGGLEYSQSPAPLTGVVFVNGNQGGSTAYPSTLVGTGPQTLVATSNPGFRQYQPYMAIQYPGSGGSSSKFLSQPSLEWPGQSTPPTSSTANGGPFIDQAGNMAHDSLIPVFVDQYPNPLPILYLRARVGAPGVISGPDPVQEFTAAPPADITTVLMDPTTNPQTPAHYNYDLAQILPYTVNGNSNVGLGIPTKGGLLAQSYGSVVSAPQHGLQGVDPTLTPTNASTTPWSWVFPENNASNQNPWQTYTVFYFANPTVAPSNASSGPFADRTGTPRGKDTFILIAAGKDRTYGTADDETSFGDVSPQQ
jgi:prepilin-type N-terminal cleavage/methylation domain-containing protein